MHGGKNISRWVVALFFLCASHSGIADDWIDLKLGTADSGLSVAVKGFAVKENSAGANRLYSATLRYGSYILDRKYYRELSFGSGLRYSHKYGSTTLEAGIGLLELENKERAQALVATIPLVASFTLGKYLGFSGSVFINVNRVKPLLGVELGIALGKFR